MSTLKGPPLKISIKVPWQVLLKVGAFIQDCKMVQYLFKDSRNVIHGYGYGYSKILLNKQLNTRVLILIYNMNTPL